MKRWLPAIVFLCTVAALFVYLFSARSRVTPGKQNDSHSPANHVTVSSPPSAPKPGQQSTHAIATAVSNVVSTNNLTATAIVDAPSGTPVVLPEPDVPEQELPQLPASTALENVRAVFRQYSSKFGGNPVGTNLEITRALNGENPRQIRFLRMEDGMRVNAKGELIDNWGTPYFFHQLSGSEMEIHSAGPDKRLGTADDLVIK